MLLPFSQFLFIFPFPSLLARERICASNKFLSSLCVYVFYGPILEVFYKVLSFLTGIFYQLFNLLFKNCLGFIMFLESIQTKMSENVGV